MKVNIDVVPRVNRSTLQREELARELVPLEGRRRRESPADAAARMLAAALTKVLAALGREPRAGDQIDVQITFRIEGDLPPN
jgi:hypothetical protein